MNLSKFENLSPIGNGKSVDGLPIPKPSAKLFKQGIQHPDLYLWDVWSAREESTIHLYCLAVSNRDAQGDVFAPQQRNTVAFHVRHFVSEDEGKSWLDKGCYQSARTEGNDFDSRSIWSGSILQLEDGSQLTAFTGIRKQTNELCFQQSLGLSKSSNWSRAEPDSIQLISDPLTDYDKIIEAGYFLSERELLGHKDGEAGGPILAWRDPFLFSHQGQIHLFWSAKVDCRTPALAHALLHETDTGFEIGRIYAPVEMPDGHEYTQLELPKILFDHVNQRFLLLVASCNRLDERQSDAEADKRVRMYVAKSVDGPWKQFGHEGSTLKLAEPNVFGITVISADFEQQILNYVAPYTEDAGSSKFLTLSKTHSLDIAALSDQ